jgi:hypothetical protein
MAANLIIICHACEFRQQQCAGPCPCTVDGRDIIEHARAGDCPKGKYDRLPPATPSTYTSTPPQPIPRAQWPLWASTIARWQEAGDVGVGDTIHRKLGILGVIFKETLKAMGVPCGCDERQAEFNTMYPY